jgi:FkbM family methyltransferase
VLAQIVNNVRDARVLGLGFVARHLRGGTAHYRFNLKAIGPVMIRSGGSDAQVIRQIFRDRAYDLERAGPAHERLEKRYREILASGRKPLIVDAGANIGAASLWFHRDFPEAEILAVEPDPANFALLRENVAALPTIRPLRAALGGHPGKVSVSSEGESWGLQTTRDDGGDTDIVTIGQLFDGEGEGRIPFLVKIDIEGFEADVFDGPCDWLDLVAGIILEPHDWMLPAGRSSQSFQGEMGRRDFQIFISGENLIYIR